jgi:anti-sigma B factor antagonist
MTVSMHPTDGAGPLPTLGLLESRVGHRLVLAVDGEVDLASAPALRTALLGALESGAAEIWLDLSRVAFMDSIGLTVLVETHEQLGERRFALICPDGPVRRLLAVAGMDRVIPVHANRSAAHAEG